MLAPQDYNPPGGALPKTTADAGIIKSVKEERTPVSHFYRCPVHHVTDQLCGVRYPSTPGDPMAKEDLARAVRRHRLIAASYVA